MAGGIHITIVASGIQAYVVAMTEANPKNLHDSD